MKNRILILKEPSTKLTLYPEYLHLKSIYHDTIIAYAHIQAIYLNKSINIDIATCYALSQKVPLTIIDEHGYLLATLQKVKDA